MKINELMAQPNDMDHMIERVAVIAGICNKMGNKPLMYRQVKDVFNNAYKFVVKVTPEENREAHGNKVNPAQEKVIQQLGIKNPVWATLEPHAGTRGPFGGYSTFTNSLKTQMSIESPQMLLRGRRNHFLILATPLLYSYLSRSCSKANSLWTKLQ